ncbi:MAG: hypothetical protein AB7Q17_16590 [Phycisphaerae bacterium]
MALGIFTHPIGAFAQLDPNDPWPKYAHNERNSARTWFRGPHSRPYLRWFGQAGFGDVTEDCPLAGDRRGGAAIAKVNGARYIFVTGNVGGDACIEPPDTPTLTIFRYHPPGRDNDCTCEPATPVATIELAGGEQVLSTPLVLKRIIGEEEHVRVYIQTKRKLFCYDASELIGPLGGSGDPPTHVWTYPSDDSFAAAGGFHASSPIAGREYADGSGPDYIYLLADFANEFPSTGTTSYVVRLEPDASDPTASAEYVAVRANATNLSTPAIGPAGDDEFERNFVYVTTFAAATQPALHAVLADMDAGSVHDAEIHSCPRVQGGSFASPAVHDLIVSGESLVPPNLGTVVVASDDAGLYSFDNTLDSSAPYVLTERHHECFEIAPPPNGSFSGTGVVFDDRHVMYINEQGIVYRIHDPHDDEFTPEGELGLDVLKSAWKWSNPAGDAAGRFYVATPGGGGFADERRVLALNNDDDGNDVILRAWGGARFVPPDLNEAPCETEFDLFQQFEAPLAIDEDGTLIVCNRGFVLALRPLLGDLDGNGIIDMEPDIDAFVLALIDVEEWQESIGLPLGVNLLGVGDCNNDGVFNNYDINCIEDSLEDPVNSGPCAGSDEESASYGSENSEYLASTVAWLRVVFGME